MANKKTAVSPALSVFSWAEFTLQSAFREACLLRPAHRVAGSVSALLFGQTARQTSRAGVSRIDPADRVHHTPYHRRMSTGSKFERARLVDIGVNFHSGQLVSLTDQLLVRARVANVTQILATGTSAASSRLALELARANPGIVFATAGVHPHGAKSYDPSTVRELTELWKCTEVVAIGECGLDYNRNFSPPQAQRIAFE